MQRELLIHLRCPVCGGGLRITHPRSIQNRISSGVIRCRSCDYRSRIAARIPLLLPPGVEAVYRSPFERVAGDDYQRFGEQHGWDRLTGMILKTPGNQLRPYSLETLSQYYFRKSVFEGSDYYYELLIRSLEEDEPSPMLSWESLITRIVEKAPHRVLEIGCGSGRFSERLLPYRPASALTLCMDLDFNGMKILEGRYRRLGKSSAFLPVAADVRKLPVPDKHFDMVVSHYGYDAVETVNVAFEETARVIKPGGTLLVVESAGGYEFQQSGNIEELLLHALRRHLEMHQGALDIEQRLLKRGFIVKHRRICKTPRHRFIVLEAVYA